MTSEGILKKKRKQTFYIDELLGETGGKVDITSGDAINRGATQTVGGNVFVGGNVKSAGGTFMGIDNRPDYFNQQEIEEIFEPIHQAVSKTQENNRDYCQSWVTNLKFEAIKGKDADPTTVESSIRNIANITPDIFPTLFTVLTNPDIAVRMNPLFEKLIRQYASK